jgi:hypothetical protein
VAEEEAETVVEEETEQGEPEEAEEISEKAAADAPPGESVVLGEENRLASGAE